jgi:hypothetical protein
MPCPNDHRQCAVNRLRAFCHDCFPAANRNHLAHYRYRSFSLLQHRPRSKNFARPSNQPKHRHNRPTRNSPRHRSKHRQIHCRFPQSQRPLPTHRRPPRDQRNFQIKTRKAAPLRHGRTSSTQPASGQPASGFLFTQFSESHVSITASRSD